MEMPGTEVGLYQSSVKKSQFRSLLPALMPLTMRKGDLKVVYNIGTDYKRRMVTGMPTIIPISDLKNYTSVVNQVSYGNRVYLTKNGHGNCVLIDMSELDELDKDRALLKLMGKLGEAKISVKEEGTISADDLEKELGV